MSTSICQTPDSQWNTQALQRLMHEWDNQIVRIPREEDAVIEADGSRATFIMGPQKNSGLLSQKTNF